MAEEIDVQPEAIIQEQPEAGFLNKLKIHKFKILGGILGVLIFAGAVFGAYKFGQRQVQPGPQPTPTPVVVATPTPLPSEAPAKEGDPTANWETYFNKGLDFSIKLPPNWRRSEQLSIKTETITEEIFTPLSEEQISEILRSDPYNPTYYLEVGVKDNPNNILLREWATNSKYSPQGADQMVTEAVLNNYSGIKVVGNQGPGYVDYFIWHGGRVYNLGYYYFDNDPTWKRVGEVSKELFNLMLSTFRFLE